MTIYMKQESIYLALIRGAHNYRAYELLPPGGVVVLSFNPAQQRYPTACGWVSGRLVGGLPSADSRSWEPGVYAVANDETDGVTRVFQANGGNRYEGAARWKEVVLDVEVAGGAA